MPNVDGPVNLPASFVSPGGVAELALEAELRDVREITASLFPGPYSVEQVEDPEISGERYFVFHEIPRDLGREVFRLPCFGPGDDRRNCWKARRVARQTSANRPRKARHIPSFD